MITRSTHQSILGDVSIETQNGYLTKLLFGSIEETQESPDKEIESGVLEAINENTINHKLWLKCKLIGSSFQVTVWDAIRTIPKGQTANYKWLAETIGRPNAVRAVGTACGANPIAIIIPCHRVIKSNGQMGNYAYGSLLKKKLLNREGVFW